MQIQLLKDDVRNNSGELGLYILFVKAKKYIINNSEKKTPVVENPQM